MSDSATPAAPTPAATPGPRAWLTAVPAIALLLVALWEIIATLTARAPDDADWAAAATVVRADHAPGDLIVFAPAWADPIGRLHLGDLIPLDMAARNDAARYATIWEVAIGDATAPDTRGLTATRTTTVGGIRVRRYQQTPVALAADLLARLPSAKIAGAPQRPITIELAEVGFAPHRCIQVVPPPGAPVRITFPAVPGTQLAGGVGIADVFTRRDVRAPVHLAVEIGGAVATRVTAGVDDGWVRFAAPKPPEAVDVTFVLEAAVGGRLLCFAAEAR